MTFENQSIHPRVVKGRTIYAKVNTANPPAIPLRGTLRKVTKRIETRRHDRDMSVESLKRHAKFDPDKAYRKPGSMKP